MKRAEPNPRPSAAATVYERIRHLILTNTIPPDSKLNIDGLARELGVSQTPVREALQRLEGDRLVLAKQTRGYWTSPLLDEDGLDHLFEVRLLIEPWAAGAAAVDRASNPGLWLTREIERFELDDGDGLPGEALVRHDTAFHMAIIEAVGNPFLAEAFERTHAHLHLFRLYTDDMDSSVTIEEHRIIADAIARSDARAATTAMRTHLFSALHRFGRGLGGSASNSQLHSITSSVLGLERPECAR